MIIFKFHRPSPVPIPVTKISHKPSMVNIKELGNHDIIALFNRLRRATGNQPTATRYAAVNNPN